VDTDEVLKVLRSIDRRLALLVGPQERAMRDALKADVLNTEPRERMFYAIDGIKGTSDLAEVGGITARGALNFANQLVEMGLVRSIGTGRELVLARDDDGVVEWYLRWVTRHQTAES
jgi:hypothetical protein